jgi:NAD(P)-dependent dehydrogenase (short-subunit alcohol dehydrogenase family)
VAPEKRLDILETTAESYDRVLSVNTRGTFFLTQAVARHMADRTGEPKVAPPAIVFITSISAYMSSPSRAEYCISKAAASCAVRLFAHRLTEFGIHLFEVRPGITRTDMTKPVEDQYDHFIRSGGVPQGRWGEPGDVGRAVAALVGGDFTYSTGMIVEVSGGMQIQRL